MTTTPRPAESERTGRLLLAAYLRSERAFGRAPARAALPADRWNELLKARWLAWIAARCDLEDHLWREAEPVETRSHMATINAAGDAKVVRYRHVYRSTGRREEVTRAA